jgi:centrosomal protein CEP76
MREEPIKKKSESNYLEKKRNIEENKKENYASIVQEPKILKGATDIDTPYRTIDIIFNNKNIFMNLQHFDPTRLIYDIYDDTLWYPFVKNNFKAYPAFYPPPIMVPPLSLAQSKKLHSSIIKEMKISISALRSGKNLGTSWKNQNDYCVQLLEEHLVFLEKVDRGEVEEESINKIKRDWAMTMRQFMPTMFRFSAYPAHFNYPEPDRIASLFIDQAKDFFCVNYKNIKWAVAARVFPYSSKMISIRILVACYYPVPDGSNKY